MARIFVFLMAVLLTQLNSIAFAQWFPHATRTRPVCCLSGRYDYSLNKLTNPVTSLSFEGVLDTASISTAGTSPLASAPTRIRTFPLREKALTIDHCRISRVVVTIAENGEWSIDMVAEQNPQLLTNEKQPRIQLYQQNKFHITVRPLLGSQVVSSNSLDDVAAPTVSSLQVTPFWLEKGQTKNVHFSDYDPQLAARFDSIRQVAVDLQYE